MGEPGRGPEPGKARLCLNSLAPGENPGRRDSYFHFTDVDQKTKEKSCDLKLF